MEKKTSENGHNRHGAYRATWSRLDQLHPAETRPGSGPPGGVFCDPRGAFFQVPVPPSKPERISKSQPYPPGRIKKKRKSHPRSHLAGQKRIVAAKVAGLHPKKKNNQKGGSMQQQMIIKIQEIEKLLARAGSLLVELKKSSDVLKEASPAKPRIEEFCEFSRIGGK